MNAPAGWSGTPTFDEIGRYAAHFGVEPEQIQHDFVISTSWQRSAPTGSGSSSTAGPN